MKPAIDPMTYERTPVTYEQIKTALVAGGFYTDEDGDGDPVVITETNRIIFCSIDSQIRSIVLYTIFYGEDDDQEDKEDLADQLSAEYPILQFAVRNCNLHARIFLTCIAGLNLPELYLATQIICRDVNKLEADKRVKELFPLPRNRSSSQADPTHVN